VKLFRNLVPSDGTFGSGKGVGCTDKSRLHSGRTQASRFLLGPYDQDGSLLKTAAPQRSRRPRARRLFFRTSGEVCPNQLSSINWMPRLHGLPVFDPPVLSGPGGI